MIEKIFTSLYRIEVPLVNSPLKGLNSYVIKAPERNLIVDTGWNRQECMDALQRGLNELGVDLEKTDFFITHMHQDHIGLLPRLASHTAKVYFSEPDAERFRDGYRFQDSIDFACANGFPEEEIKSVRKRFPSARSGFDIYSHFTIVKEGDAIEAGEYHFHCIETPGHTRGHMCLYEPGKKILIAGDHILGTITPNITAWADDRNPLEEYLKSLDKISAYTVELVLPGHRDLISDCEERIQELKQHHRDRAEEVIAILKDGSQSAFQVASQISRDIIYDSWEQLSVWQKWFATGEALAHLKYLKEKGVVKRETQGKKIIFFLNRDVSYTPGRP